MTDDIDDDRFAAGLDEGSIGGVQELWYLDPQSPRWSEDSTVMPDEVWARLSDALRHESTLRSAVDGAVPITLARDVRSRVARDEVAASRARRSRWLLGSVAAGIALLGGGIVIQSVQSSREVPVVAAGDQEGGSAGRSAKGVQAEVPLMASAPGAPARRVMASGTDYQPQTLRSQVVDLLKQVGANQPSDFARMPTDGQMTAGSTGFTADLSALRACITGLTQSDLAQALVVDRARYSGGDAGLVIIPEDFVPASIAGEPVATTQTPSGNVDIWIVEPNCSRLDPGIIAHLLHQVTGE